MKKSAKIILGILLIATLTSISLYRKYLRNQARIEQQEKEREVAREYYINQKELKIKEQEEERLRILDSTGKARMDELNAGMKQLKETRERLEKEIRDSK